MGTALWSTEYAANPAGKETLVLQCSDWRFVEPTRRFLAEHLKLSGYDLVAVPGAAQFLIARLFPKYEWVARRWLKFFVKHHETKRVIVIAHDDCGWYKFINAMELFTDKLRRAQNDDIRAVAAIIAEVTGGTAQFEAYRIGAADGRVVVEKI